MKTSVKVLIVAALGVAISLAIVLKQRQGPADAGQVGSAAGLPKLLDLGADKCIPCKAMAPILARLKQEYAGMGVWTTPAVLVDGRVVISGRVPTVAELKRLLRA